MEKRYIFFGGHGRSGSNWLSSMFNLNHAEEFLSSEHDYFLGSDIFEKLDFWEERPGVKIQVSSENGPMMGLLHERFPEAQWLYLWRDYEAWLGSVLAYNSMHGHLGHAMVCINYRLGAREAELRLAERLGIKIQHVWFDDYIKESGFRALAKLMNVRLHPELKYSDQINPISRFKCRPISRRTEHPELYPALHKLFESTEYAYQAYMAAKNSDQLRM